MRNSTRFARLPIESNWHYEVCLEYPAGHNFLIRFFSPWPAGGERQGERKTWVLRGSARRAAAKPRARYRADNGAPAPDCDFHCFSTPLCTGPAPLGLRPGEQTDEPRRRPRGGFPVAARALRTRSIRPADRRAGALCTVRRQSQRRPAGRVDFLRRRYHPIPRVR